MNEFITRLNQWSAGWLDAMFAVAWQSAALALAVGVVCWALRWQSPGLRYWLWLALAAKLLALPLWSVDVTGPAWWGELGRIDARGESVRAASMVDESTRPRGGGERTGDVEMMEQRVAAPLAAEPAWYRSATWVTWLCVVWVAVVAIEVLRTGWQFVGLRRLLTSSCMAEPAVEIVVEQCAARLALARLPAVRVVQGEGSPMVCGLWRATLVLPAALVGSPLPRGERLGEGFSEHQLGSEREGMESLGIPPLAPPFEGGGENVLRQIVLHELDTCSAAICSPYG